MEYDLILAGHGGQGIMVMGQLLARAALEEGRKVLWFPEYGGAMRGGSANCTVIISSGNIGSPFRKNPCAVVAMNGPSLENFQYRVKTGGFLLVNSSLTEAKSLRDDITVWEIPATDLAKEMGDIRFANMVMLGCLVGCTGLVEFSSLKCAIEEWMSGNERLITANINALSTGTSYIKKTIEADALKKGGI